MATILLRSSLLSDELLAIFIQLTTNFFNFLKPAVTPQGLFDLFLILITSVANPVKNVKESRQTFIWITITIYGLPVCVP